MKVKDLIEKQNHMKLINYFLEKAEYLKVYLIASILLSTIIFIFLQLPIFQGILTHISNIKMFELYLTMGFIMAIPMNLKN